MSKQIRNMRIVTSERTAEGFNIYLDFSGTQEYLYQHQRNDKLYNILKDSPYVEDIRRMLRSGEYYRNPKNRANRPRAARNARMQNERLDRSISHLMVVIDSFVENR